MDADILPFTGEDKDIDLLFEVNREQIMWKKRREEDKKRMVNFYVSFYDEGPRAAPDEPLNILMIHHAQIYKVDGSNTDPEDVVGLKRFISKEDIWLLGSWNGLVALYCHAGDFFLLNPNTGKENLVKVPIKQCMHYDCVSAENYLYGICHDYDNDGEYKAVTYYSWKCSFHVVNFKRKSYEWKTQLQLPYYTSPCGGHIGTIVKGVPFWVCRVSSSYIVYYFDPKIEEFRTGPDLPNQNDNDKWCALGTLDGKLTVSLTDYAETEFWTLETSNVGSYWRPLFVSPYSYCYISTLSWMTRQVEVLLCMGDDTLMIYNVIEQTLQRLSKRVDNMVKERWTYRILAYVPSSVDPTQ